MAKSWDELEKQIMKKLVNAMNVVELKAETIMTDELFGFYAGGFPKRYKRTGQLGNSWRTSGVTQSGTSASFKAYLDMGACSYDVPNPLFDYDGTGRYSHFSTGEVFNAAEGGYAGVVGRPGFWLRSEIKFEQALKETMGQYFS